MKRDNAHKMGLRAAVEEHKAADRVDIRRICDEALGELREKMAGGSMSTKDLKRLAGDTRLRYIISRFMEALENGDLQGAEVWGEKVEQYCIARPKEITVDAGSGANLLMETIAQVVSAGVGNLRQLQEG